MYGSGGGNADDTERKGVENNPYGESVAPSDDDIIKKPAFDYEPIKGPKVESVFGDEKTQFDNATVNEFPNKARSIRGREDEGYVDYDPEEAKRSEAWRRSNFGLSGPPNARIGVFTKPPMASVTQGAAAIWSEGSPRPQVEEAAWPPPPPPDADPKMAAIEPGPRLDLPTLPEWPRAKPGQADVTWVKPDHYELHRYGPRCVWWSAEVPVQEHNNGVMINAEFSMLPHHYRQELCYDDWAIRNRNWRHVGGLCPRLPQRTEADYWKDHVPDWDVAHDLKSYRMIPHFRELHDWKKKVTMPEYAEMQFEREILDEKQLKEFFSNPDAVTYEDLEA